MVNPTIIIQGSVSGEETLDVDPGCYYLHRFNTFSGLGGVETIVSSGGTWAKLKVGVDICPTEALIKVEKQTVPDGDPDFFEFEGALAGSIRDGEFITALAEAGEYTVTVPAFPRFDIR